MNYICKSKNYQYYRQCHYKNSDSEENPSGGFGIHKIIITKPYLICKKMKKCLKYFACSVSQFSLLYSQSYLRRWFYNSWTVKFCSNKIRACCVSCSVCICFSPVGSWFKIRSSYHNRRILPQIALVNISVLGEFAFPIL